eukprot:3724719-Rhodomonas_salina.1
MSVGQQPFKVLRGRRGQLEDAPAGGHSDSVIDLAWSWVRARRWIAGVAGIAGGVDIAGGVEVGVVLREWREWRVAGVAGGLQGLFPGIGSHCMDCIAFQGVFPGGIGRSAWTAAQFMDCITPTTDTQSCADARKTCSPQRLWTSLSGSGTHPRLQNSEF